MSPTPVGNPTVNILFFGLFALLTLAVAYYAGRGSRGTRNDYYAAGKGFTAGQNGVAVAGDFISAGGVLGIVGGIAIYGADGIEYAIAGMVAWLVALLLVAELLRNVGRYTMGDVISFRLRSRPTRAAAATSTLVVSIFYLFAQMAGAGGLIALLLGVPQSNRFGQGVVIALVGLLMIFYVLVGGMRGTTWVQIIKATLLILTVLVLAAWLLGRHGFDVSGLLGDAAANSPEHGRAILGSGLQYGQSETTKLDFVSLGIATMLGPASLPHVLMRFYTVPDATQARRSVSSAIWIMGAFFACLLVVGYGATAALGPGTIMAAPGKSNSALPLLAYEMGGQLMLAVVSAVAFATILAVVAGCTLTAAASFAHDLYTNVLARREVTAGQEMRVARRAAVAVGVTGIAGGILANGQNVVFVVVLSFAIAASANLPTLLYTLFWRRFNTTGAMYSIYGGLISCVVLVVFSPAVTSRPDSMIPSVDIAFFPLTNPAVVTIPLSFLLGIVGTFVGRPERHAAERFAEMEVRALTGAGLGRPSSVDTWRSGSGMPAPGTARPAPAGGPVRTPAHAAGLFGAAPTRATTPGAPLPTRAPGPRRSTPEKVRPTMVALSPVTGSAMPPGHGPREQS